MRQSTITRTELIRDYYLHTSTLWLPPRAGFRQFRFFLSEDLSGERVIKIKDRLNNLQKLRSWLVRFAPDHVYYSTSTWLDSQNMGPKELKKRPGYDFAYNVFLSQELYFDVDVAGDLEEAKNWTRKLKKCLEDDYGFRKILMIYSGNKGFHLHIYDFELSKFELAVSEHPAVREQQTQEVKVKIVNDMMSKGLVFDADVTVDTRRIIRLPGSVNAKTLNICEIVDDLETFQPQRLADASGNEKLAG
jgi:DNA primase small subunit